MLRSVTVLGLTLLACHAAFGHEASDLLSVTLHSGRTLTGNVDRQSDDHLLWLRFERGSGYILRSIPWDEVAGAAHEGKPVEPNDVQRLALQIRSARQRSDVARPASPADEPPPLQQPSSPASLGIDAWLANWDGDVEADGLALELRLADEHGELTAANGTLEVELFAPRLRKYHEAPQSRGYYVDAIERWSPPLSAKTFRGGRALVKLPFGARHPEFDRRIDSLGLVHIRLAVPGHGVFEQSLDGIALRPFSPVRDALLDNTGRWFLPVEGTGHGKTGYAEPRY